MGVARAVGGIGVCLEGDGVEHALDVILLDGGEEGFIGGGVMRKSGGNRVDVCPVGVFAGDEFKTLFTRCVR